MDPARETDDPERPDDEPLDSLTAEPVTYGEPKLDVLTPMGQIESYGDFARGLGARRVKIALFVGGGLFLALQVVLMLQAP